MGASDRSRRHSANSPVVTRDTAATRKQRIGAATIATLLIIAASCATLFGHAAGPKSLSFIPIVATVWSLADVLTGFLLLTQFYISGRVRFGILAFAYAFSGMMTWPFILAFPGLFVSDSIAVSTAQLPSYIWIMWHFTFTALVIFATVTDAKFEHIVSHRKKIALTVIAAVAAIACTGVASVGSYLLRGMLPLMVLHGVLQPVFRFVLLPSIAALNALASYILLRRRPLTQLALWLALTTLAGALDALMLDLGAVRYSYAWYVGKFIYVFTSSNVLLAMLWDIVRMYGRLSREERTDPLTSLPTRYAFEERLRSLFHNAQQRPASLGLLVIAVDTFERYTATYGELASEECLQRIAGELLDCATRPVDFVSRFASGEFAMLLPDTQLVGVRMTAERIRSIVERLQIVRGGTAFGRITVSIGIGFTSDLRNMTEQTLFDAADRALYEAVGRGRNRVMLASVDERAIDDEPQLIAVSFGSALR